MSPIEQKVGSFVESLGTVSDGQVPGSRILGSIAKEVVESSRQSVPRNYNERYIESGPKWGEHINYSDGGRHGETYRDKGK